MPSRILLCLIASIATAAGAAAQNAAPPPASATPAALAGAVRVAPAVPAGLGANIHFTDPRPGEMEMIAASGMKWIRMDFGWGGTERRKGEYNFEAYDRLLAALDKQKIRALFILDYGNRLYDNEGAPPQRGGHVLPPTSDEGRAAMARWAAAAVARFKGKDILWEMWNEPNIPQFWRPKPDVQAYVKLARTVGAAIRQAAPQELYIGPATSTMDFKFLEECFKGGLLEDWHAVSVHPYRQEAPETVIRDYARLREMIDRYAPPGKAIPIISGEWGYSAAWKNYDQDRQGKMLPRQWLVNLSCSVPVSIWYDWHDDGRDPKEPEHHFGMVAFEYLAGKTPVYAPKPAYQAAQTLTRTLAGLTFQRRLPAGDDNYALLFGEGKRGVLAAWTTAKEPREVRVQLPADIPAGQRKLTGHTGQPAGQADVQGGAVTLKLTDAPLYME